MRRKNDFCESSRSNAQFENNTTDLGRPNRQITSVVNGMDDGGYLPRGYNPSIENDLIVHGGIRSVDVPRMMSPLSLLAAETFQEECRVMYIRTHYRQ